MDVNYKPLTSSLLADGAQVQQPFGFAPRPVRPDSPAIEVMTDLRLVPAATIDADDPLAHAQQAMIARGVRSLLVTDHRGAVSGLLTARDLLGERPLQAVRDRGVRHEELRVSDVMTLQYAIEALDIAEVLRARVGNIVATLRASGRQHALVVEAGLLDGVSVVRGVFSLSQIARQLGIPLQTVEIARTFAEIEEVIARSHA